MAADIGVSSEELADDAHSSGDGAELADGPVAQHAHQLIVGQRFTVDVGCQKVHRDAGGSIRPTGAGLSEHVSDDPVELLRDPIQLGAITFRRCQGTSIRPSQKWVGHGLGPSQIRALGSRRKRQGQLGHDFDLVTSGNGSFDEVGGQVA